MKLGVICDGISRDLAHAVDVMDEFGLEYAELQFVGEKEVGDHSPEEIKAIDALLRDRGKPVSCLSRHIFAGMTAARTAVEPGLERVVFRLAAVPTEDHQPAEISDDSDSS